MRWLLGLLLQGLRVGLGLNAEVVHNLQDTAAAYSSITSANECDGSLFLGSLTMPAVARYPL